MNEEICCITKERETGKNEWEKDDSDFLLPLSKQKRNNSFPSLVILFKEIYSSVKNYKYFNKLIS